VHSLNAKKGHKNWIIEIGDEQSLTSSPCLITRTTHFAMWRLTVIRFGCRSREVASKKAPIPQGIGAWETLNQP